MKPLPYILLGVGVWLGLVSLVGLFVAILRDVGVMRAPDYTETLALIAVWVGAGLSLLAGSIDRIQR